MEKKSFIDKDLIFLFFVSIAINFFYLRLIDKYTYFWGYKYIQSEIAYNFCISNSFKINKDRVSKLNNDYQTCRKNQEYKVQEYKNLDHSQYLEADIYPDVDITPWYSLILGLLWKLTHSFSSKDIIYLQILLFSLCIILVYQTAYILFKSSHYAFAVSLSTILFFPLIFHNVVVLRDIWPFYSTTVLLYTIFSYLYNEKSIVYVFVGGIFFSICQLVRFTSFATLCTIAFCLFIYALMRFFCRKKVFLIINSLIITNILFYWVPFFAYNLHVYQRFFISSLGQVVLEGFGEVENKWGYKCDDAWFRFFMHKKFNLQSGTPECDERAKELVIKAICEEPLFYISLVIKRLGQVILPDMNWLPYFFDDECYTQLQTKNERFQYILDQCHSSYKNLIFNFFSHFYIRLYILLGYLGLLLMFFNGHRKMAFLLMNIIVSSWFIIFIHVECRYILYTFGFIPYGLGYLYIYLLEIILRLKRKIFVFSVDPDQII